MPLLVLVATSLAGCVWEPLGDRNLRQEQSQHLRRQIVVAAQKAQLQSREIAALRADLRTLQDAQRQLFGQVAELQQASRSRAGRIQELQDLVAALESRLQTSDENWRQRMATLKSSLARDQQKALDAVASSVGREISRAVKQVAPAPAPTLGYTEYTVAPGDTLSAIAQAAGVSVEAIKAANGLKSDLIQVGQSLKVPSR